MGLLDIPTVTTLRQQQRQAEIVKAQKRLTSQIKEIKEQFHKLENIYSDERIRISGKLEPELAKELKEKGYVLKYEVDNGPNGSGYDYTYIGLNR